MILKLRQRMTQEESGFTLVELLVVMLILGLLAAIAIPAFFNQRDKAKDADAKATVRTAQTAMETFATENGDNGYTGADVVNDLYRIEPTLKDQPGDTLEFVGTPDADTYHLKVTSTSGNTFEIDRRDTGETFYPCAA